MTQLKHPVRTGLMTAGLAASALLLAACGEDGAAALQKVENAAATARQASEQLSESAALAEEAVRDPAGAVRNSALSARFSRAATAQPNLFVLTDIATGCQYLATYAADGSTVQSITPRIDGAEGKQRCIVPGADGLKAPDAASLVGKAIGGLGGGSSEAAP